MTFHATFIGGPWDGETREMPDARDRWYMLRMPILSGLVASPEELLPPLDPIIYERETAPVAGELVYRWRP